MSRMPFNVKRMTKKSKFGNERTNVAGMWFDSKREAAYYGELLYREKARELTGIRCQVPFDIRINGQLICKYIADFVYVDQRPGPGLGREVVVDVKGFKTPEYRLKKKLMAAVHGVTIVEV